METFIKTYATRTGAQRAADRMNEADESRAWVIGCGLDGRWFLEDMNTAESICWSDGSGNTRITYYN